MGGLFLKLKVFAAIFVSMFRKILSKEQAIQKLRHYCRYQERCHSEVREKLWQLGVKRSEHDEIVSSLIEDDYLNEERFATQFASGKYRLKQWGRVKIKYELKQKQVSEYSIKKSLQQIDETDYLKTLKILAEKRYEALKNEQWLVRKKKTIDYLLLKGFEHSLINNVVSDL
jgi:regulatory protein